MPRNVTIKTEAGPIDGTPDKRVFWSIIADYGLRTGLCELLDNAIDLWMLNGQGSPLTLKIGLDTQRQIVTVEDDAGGVPFAELRLLIAPGGSRNSPNAPIIGVFGVGSKRASVAIGEHVEIRSRHKTNASYQLDITKEWLQSSDWNLAAYQIPEISSNTTQVEISKLRRPFDEAEIELLKLHIAETYSWFIDKGCTILLNDLEIKPINFDTFSFPQKYLPRRAISA